MDGGNFTWICAQLVVRLSIKVLSVAAITVEMETTAHATDEELMESHHLELCNQQAFLQYQISRQTAVLFSMTKNTLPVLHNVKG